MTKEELKKRVEGLDEETKKKVICSLIGHSKISTTCFGYRYCGRCGQQVGDSLGSIDVGIEDAVLVGHKCETCQANYKKCSWEDKLFCKDPFVCSSHDDKYEKLPYLEVL